MEKGVIPFALKLFLFWATYPFLFLREKGRDREKGIRLPSPAFTDSWKSPLKEMNKKH